ncbi:peptide deformylase [Myxococcota bacterium]|nr:peptide deformylase [Myxococcota bacterium]MBU1898423.1 peptide deformylase [Myxococcota bacterium]
MVIHNILTWPDPGLRRHAAPVSAFDAHLRALVDDLFETMYATQGIGIAAPQIGVSLRVVVIDCGEPDGPIALVNPEIVAVSEEIISFGEGCLSLPDVFAEVDRYAAIEVRYQDLNGAPQQRVAEDLLAVCVQHELDHLNGMVFIDRLGRLERLMVMSNYQGDGEAVLDAAT